MGSLSPQAARLFLIHGLRHEAASRFLEAGGTLRELQVLGGWLSLEMVERYSRVDRERIRRTLAKMPPPFAECTVSAPTLLAPAVELTKELIPWSGRPGSNRRPSAPKENLSLRDFSASFGIRGLRSSTECPEASGSIL
jgi:hypothetical protein